MSHHTLNAHRVGLAVGLTCGLGMLFLGVLATLFDYGTILVHMLGTVYIGYSATLVGSFFGFAWGLVDGFIGGALFVWLYNRVK